NQPSAASGIPARLHAPLCRSQGASALARHPLVSTPAYWFLQPPPPPPLCILAGTNPGQPHSRSDELMSYQLRRLRLHGIIERIPQTHRYRITHSGLRTVWFYTRTYSRIPRPGLGTLLPQLSPPSSSLRRCFDKLDHEVTEWIQRAKLAA